MLTRIFDPFFTTKPTGKGTGLSMSMVAGIVQSHGGFLNVESESGTGTVFELFFPALLEPVGAAGKSSAPPFAAQGRGEWVLVIDDDATLCETCQLLLQAVGYRVVTAGDGRSGIGIFEREPDKFAVVVTDILMPQLRGTEVIAALRRIRPSQPIVAVSGWLDARTRLELQDIKPAVPCLSKPVATDLLLQTLHDVRGGVPRMDS